VVQGSQDFVVAFIHTYAPESAAWTRVQQTMWEVRAYSWHSIDSDAEKADY
jgi:hypothetical protein